MNANDLILLYDYYGMLLTQRQRECFELRYNQDLSLGEIGEELGISRQGVHDNLSRTEALLKNMEEKTGCVSRDLKCRRTAQQILVLSEELETHADGNVARSGRMIADLARELKE